MSIVRAAESLHLSQPTLSTQIKNMEKELGKQLLIRGTKGSRKNKGLLDFGIVFGNVDLTKYNALNLPVKDVWGMLMRRDSPLASKEKISPEDLRKLPLILSQQEDRGGSLTQWFQCQVTELNIAATYNLIYKCLFACR